MSLTLTPPKGQYKRGTVFVHDYFSNKPNRPEHGEVVSRAAKDQGFKGPVVGQQIANPTKRSELLTSTTISSDAFNKAFDEQVVTMRKNPLVNATKTMRTLDKQGVSHSALNLSQGGSKASTVQHFYDSMRLAWDPKSTRDYSGDYMNRKGKNLLSNFAKANGLDEAKLLSKDPKVFGPERAKLQQTLVSRVGGAVNGNEDIKTAQSDYDKAVKSFESRNNSVVVAGENDGELMRTFKKDLGGEKLAIKAKKNFFDNPLANDQTTIVGAVNDKGTAKASYSTRSTLPEIYAKGSIVTDQWGTTEQGTSFAAPRVAAAMARLHQMNPHLSSQQIEDMIVGAKSKPLQTRKGELRVLDTNKVKELYK